jgi:hypothetical protein
LLPLSSHSGTYLYQSQQQSKNKAGSNSTEKIHSQ